MATSVPQAELIETELRQVRGVLAARVVVDSSAITEVHILSSLARPVKQLIRDVESVCAARFRLEIDHRCISVAQIEAESDANSVLPRPKLHSVRVETTDTGVLVVVQLAAGELLFSGEAQGMAAGKTTARLAAKAAIRALDNYLEGSVTLELLDINEFTMSGHRGYAVAITLLSRRSEEKLIGSALVKYDDPDACVRAVLNAMNRRLPLAVNKADRKRS